MSSSEQNVSSAAAVAAEAEAINGITENVANLQLDAVTGEMVSKSYTHFFYFCKIILIISLSL